jgi:hypothetical protein
MFPKRRFKRVFLLATFLFRPKVLMYDPHVVRGVPRAFRPWIAASGVVAAQVVLVLSQAPGETLARRYIEVCKWDCHDWYLDIATHGYRSVLPPVAGSPNRANVAFFPGFPIMARALHLVTGADATVLLLLISQVAAVGFWALYLLLLQDLAVESRQRALWTVALLAHPASFILVCGFSESLFMAGLLGFLRYGVLKVGEGGQKRGWIIAALCGFVMTATRILGLPVTAIPLLANRAPRRAAPLAIAAIASLGALLFFLYCQVKFGAYDLYMQTQRIGWDARPRLAGLVDWSLWWFYYPWDARSMTLSILLLALVLALEVLALALRRGSEHRRFRLLAWLASFAMWAMVVVGFNYSGFWSLTRYTLCWIALLFLCLASLGRDLPPSLADRLERVSPWIRVIAAAAAVLFALWVVGRYQVHHIHEHTRGKWFV